MPGSYTYDSAAFYESPQLWVHFSYYWETLMKKLEFQQRKRWARLGDVSAVGNLIISLNDKSWEVRAEAAKSLGTLGDKQAVGKLKQALSEENWSVRHNAADALYRLGEEGIEALHETLRLGEGVPRTVAAQTLTERTLGV
jgi:HEAT repeat protein